MDSYSQNYTLTPLSHRAKLSYTWMPLYSRMMWSQLFLVCIQGPPGPAGLQGPIGAPGPAVSTHALKSMNESHKWNEKTGWKIYAS